ncbi:glycoside hydrolase family 3 N-terminal domain-containing protein [Brevibacterium luteolum]|uniref:glycoside hydrolase family 3 N-terminal domain-containing protein n=1 Tax=Brevibacterium luteolum TaxID=199591 RepID=UPI00223BDDA6|nr:glycoside hydrolase family 3 N-terminal domain-containing protein [Brevibacterium luteolum]MCT1873489.1 glycosyl hydrolase [Brevibacterium luteolum]MCT1890877.1 glycosyl hydrolase [Brevibacterium luteolum]MCT1893327.1 glycosyl hydrolase [Brevibacterium luteolum]MCT1924087.1 glycosyl hydrolase [Brevibacterium luteolum]
MARTSSIVLAGLLAGALTLTGCSRGETDGPQEQSSPVAAETPAANSPTTSAQPDARPGDFTDEAKGIVAEMNDTALAGAVIMGSYDGTDAAAGAKLIRDDKLAGVIVMPYNLPQDVDRQTLRKMTDQFRTASGERGWQTMIGVDQEGGPVTRAGSAAVELPPLMAHGAADDPALTSQITALQGRDLIELGFTTDFAPVADVTVGKGDPAISVRSAGDDPQRVSSVVEAAVTGYDEAGIISSLKHFPGHGALTEDSHETLPVSQKSLDELADRDFVPFADAAEAGVATSMMVGHIALPGDETLPASLNPKAYQALREDVGFEGLIVTDALNMGAVTAGSPGQETVKALAAGADLALLPPDSAAAAEAVRTALGDGTLKRADLEESATRVVAAQLWQTATAGDAGDDAGKSEDDQRQQLAEAALTVMNGECRFAEPVDEVSVTGSDLGVKAFTEAAKEAGLNVTDGAETTVALVPGPLLGSETVKQAKARNSKKADVAVALSGPWELDGYESGTQLAIYDDWQPGMTAVARYLTGDLEATGSLPVKVEGVNPPDCS